METKEMMKMDTEIKTITGNSIIHPINSFMLFLL